MKIRKSKKQLLLYYMAGFFVGILYANIVGGNAPDSSGIFQEYFLRQYMQTEINVKEYFFYLLQLRLFPLSLLAIAGCSRFKSSAAAVFLLWTGFSGGIVAVAAVLNLGMKGMLICIAGMFPHMIAYGFGYAILLWYLYGYPQIRWNIWKSTTVGGIFLIGIFMEAYVNPDIMKLFIRLLG